MDLEEALVREMLYDAKAGYDPHQVRDPHTGEWIDMLGLPEPSLPQLEAMQWYEMGYGVDDSQALRAVEGDVDALADDEVRERVAQLISLIEQQSEDSPMLYRCVDGAKLSPEQRSLLQPGGVFTDWGFSATAEQREFVDDWAIDPLTKVKEPLIFRISPTRGMNVNAVAERQGWDVEKMDPDMPDLTEWLLPPGTRYRVDAISDGVVDVTVVF